jgi:hypothetical protein
LLQKDLPTALKHTIMDPDSLRDIILYQQPQEAQSMFSVRKCCQ